MKYLLKLKDRYYYNRRVPDEVRGLDTRGNVRIALKTDSKEQARRKSVILNDQIEAYWKSLLANGESHENKKFNKTVLIARQMGFCYQPMSAIAALPIHELVERLLAVKGADPVQAEAILGARDEPEISIRDGLEKFWVFTKDRIVNKTPDQIRKWKNPRIKAIDNLIKVIGNKSLTDLNREYVIQFRDWWLERIAQDGISAGTANKDLVYIKNIVETVNDNLKLGLDAPHLFRKIMLRERFGQTRLPLSPDQIRTILHSEKLSKLNDQARWFLFAAAETGARPSEIAGLLPEDIRLDAEVPHISITDRMNRSLKNAHSAREIPLVGYALDAFKANPNGFPRYRDKPDNLTNSVNKFLRENDLLPSANHSVYSLRHSFQDRILGVNVPDRIQADLMGHKFKRPKYGDGAALSNKFYWMNQVCLKDEVHRL